MTKILLSIASLALVLSYSAQALVVNTSPDQGWCKANGFSSADKCNSMKAKCAYNAKKRADKTINEEEYNVHTDFIITNC